MDVTFIFSAPTFDLTDQSDIAEPTSPLFNDDSVVPGTTYYYEVFGSTDGGPAMLIGKASITTPAADTAIVPLISSASGGNGASQSAPTGLNSIGVNNLEIFVTWNNTALNETGFTIQISSDQVNWYTAGTAPANARSFIVRGCGPGGSQFLQENVKYYLRADADNLNGPSVWSDETSAYVRFPNVTVDNAHDLLVICGGNRYPIEDMLNGITIGIDGLLVGGTSGNSLGWVWARDVNDGYNAFLVADPGDGGAPPGSTGVPPFNVPADATNDILNNDGSGRIYDEIQYELHGDGGHENIHNLGLIGYSHGGGMVYNMAQKLGADTNTPKNTKMAFVGTIDAVVYGTGPDSKSPFGGWYVSGPVMISPAQGWGIFGFNYYETYGWSPILQTLGLVNAYGGPMADAVNTVYPDLTHSSIATNPQVLADLERQCDAAFQSLSD